MPRRRTRAELDAEQEGLIDRLMEIPEKELECRDPGLAHNWMLVENYHVIQARYRGVAMRMIARDSVCRGEGDRGCGKTKQERWIIGKGDLLVKTGNHYSKYEVVLSGYARGRVRAASIWTAGYRKAMQARAEAERASPTKAG